MMFEAGSDTVQPRPRLAQRVRDRRGGASTLPGNLGPTAAARVIRARFLERLPRATGVDPGGRYTNTNTSLRAISGFHANAVVIGPRHEYRI
jgi:hypothetical protein